MEERQGATDAGRRYRMTPYQHALALAARGFHVFPLIEGAKLPLIEDFPNRATRDPATLAQWWNADMGETFTLPYNVGIYTGRYGDDPDVSLCVIDVDNKNDKRGSDTILRMELEGFDFPATYTQDTPTGGHHIVYVTRTPVRNMVDRDGKGSIGRGLDIRGVGGFIVAAGSATEKGAYTGNALPVVDAPQALIERILSSGGAPIERQEPSAEMLAGLDPERVMERAIDYLRNRAPEAIEGSGGDATTFKVAAQLKDIGVPQTDATGLMLEHWFDGCGWSLSDLEVKVANAYRYGKTAPGAAAPEMQFQPLTGGDSAQRLLEGADVADGGYENHPLNRLNTEFAFVLIGGSHSILWETTDAEGKTETRLLNEDAFHKMHSGVAFPLSKKKKGKKGEPDETVIEHVSLTKFWMDAPGRDTPPSVDLGEHPFWRRSYKGIYFMPGRPCPAGWYNGWRGFVCTPHEDGDPISAEAQWAFDAWKEHLLLNVCRNDADVNRWQTGWFAHMIQRPWEKPLVAPVYKGRKGTGKNSCVERVADLLGAHAMVTHERRYLTSQFNGHMQSLLLLVLDEAVWAGDKEGEGKLKGVITGAHHAIELKGKEIFRVPNFTRVSIIGNEDWLVPATEDERRFAVHGMAEGRMKDKPFFERMRIGMQQHGGDRLLLRYLLDFDLSTVDVNEAPITEALLEQKTESLEPLAQWWYDSLQQGELIGGAFAGAWPEEVGGQTLIDTVGRHFRSRNIRTRMPTDTSIGRAIKKFSPSTTHGRKGRNADGKQPYVYRLAPLLKAREDWENFIGHTVTWSCDV
ncbi:MAG TPA: bifunctional DNA primase/polymerase [Solimonas sp.]|nr:bifunctional DNA primase/polymerase [Solimonas sp.]